MSVKTKDKNKSYNELDLKKLIELLKEQKKNLFEVSQQVKLGTNTKNSEIKSLKKDIARINTAITAKQKQEG